MAVGAWNGRPQLDIDIWGPWQAVMEEVVNSCEQHVRRLRTTLQRQSSEGLEQFRAEASELFDVSSELTERCEDHARWIEARSSESIDAASVLVVEKIQ